MKHDYDSKISVRTSNTFCVHLPKSLISSGVFVVGDEVEVTLKKKEAQ